MAEAAWTKLFHDDFLQGCRAANLSAEEVGIYAVVLFLIASRGAPIEYDSQWIAGYAGCSTRKATTVINKLAAMRGKLVVRNGMIGNHKMLRVIGDRDKKSDQARRAAHARWHGDDAELPFDNYPPDYRPDKQEDNPEIIAPIKSRKRQKTAKAADADACSPRARAGLRDSESITTQPNLEKLVDAAAPPAVGSGRDDKMGEGGMLNPDLRQLYESVSAASGHNPSSPAQISRAMGFIEKWREQGIDFDAVVIPTIRAAIANTSEPTRTLGRFDPAIQHEHARRDASDKAGKRYVAPASPILEPTDESEEFRPLRVELLARIGVIAFCRYANDARFEVVDGVGDRRIMRVRDKRLGALSLMDDARSGVVREIARKLGFSEVW